MPFASCPISRHHWEGWLCLHHSPPPGVFTHGEVPRPNSSPRSQPFLCQMFQSLQCLCSPSLDLLQCVHVCPVLQPVPVPLKGSTPIWCICHPPSFASSANLLRAIYECNLWESPLDVAGCNIIPSLANAPAAQHIKPDSELAALVELGRPQVHGEQPAPGLMAPEGCWGILWGDGHHPPVTNVPEGQLSHRQLEWKCNSELLRELNITERQIHRLGNAGKQHHSEAMPTCLHLRFMNSPTVIWKRTGGVSRDLTDVSYRFSVWQSIRFTFKLYFPFMDLGKGWWAWSWCCDLEGRQAAGFPF